MKQQLIFDQQKIARYESEQTILGFLLHCEGINQDFHKFISEAAGSLDVYTGENIRIFFIESRSTTRQEELFEIDTSIVEPKNVIGFLTPDSLIRPNTGYTRRTETIRVAALGEYFLEGELWKMPCLVFFSSFSSREFYLFELDSLTDKEVSDLILQLSSEAKKIWNARAPVEGDGEHQRIRELTFIEFESCLNRKRFGIKAKKIVNSSAIITIVSAAAGLI